MREGTRRGKREEGKEEGRKEVWSAYLIMLG